jgi:NAD(P)-dependent dehydrogenase (short-subunit alcohol dehydrogenase family)
VADEIGGLAIECNVADEASAKTAFATIKEKHSPAKVLVNCAGIGTSARIVGKNGPMPLADFTNIINVNLIGSFNMMRLAAAEMITSEPGQDGERGVIISTVSVAAFEGQIGQAAYAASKRNSKFDFTSSASSQFGIQECNCSWFILNPLMNELSEEAKQNLSSHTFPNV